MPEPPDRDPDPAAAMADILAGHAAALHGLFMRKFADIVSNNERSRRDVSRALKAQAQCRIALKLLLALRAAKQSSKKSRNRTNRLLKVRKEQHDQRFVRILVQPAE